jgi:tetratricopeptide (TPR) repeat protein
MTFQAGRRGFEKRIRFILFDLLSLIAAFFTMSAAAGETAPQDEKPVVFTGVDLSHPALLPLNFEKDAFQDWSVLYRARVEAVLAPAAGAARDAAIQVTFLRAGGGTVDIAGRPGWTDAERKALIEKLQPEKWPRPLLADFEVRFDLRLAGGARTAKPGEAAAPLEPALRPLRERRAAELEKLDAPARLAAIRAWSQQEVVPALAKILGASDEKFQGLHSLGRLITGIDYSKPVWPPGFLDTRNDYWRALMESAPGDETVASVRIFLHAAAGELDPADRLLDLSLRFGRAEGQPFLLELRDKLRVFHGDIHRRVAEGIKLHDAGRFDEAVRVYESVLKDYPGSALAQYELYQTRDQLSAGVLITDGRRPWPQYRARILAADPLFPAEEPASDKRAAYYAVRRFQIRELFLEKGQEQRDLLRYADIAMDLGQFSFAAHAYRRFLGPGVEPPDKRDVMAHFAYCIDRAGAKDLPPFLVKDLAAAFAAVDALRNRRVEAFEEAWKEEDGRKEKGELKKDEGEKGEAKDETNR